MNPLIAILTYNRPTYIQDLISSLEKCRYKIIVFDDCSTDQRFGGALGTEFKFATTHGGVAKNSNRAIKFFRDRRIYDVLFILNDDLFVKDVNIFDVYMNAIQKTGYHHFCYTDMHSPVNPSEEFTKKGVTLIRRMSGDGVFLTITRKMVDVLGGFDINFGIFGAEHVDYSRRAAAAGFCKDNLDVKEAKDMLLVRQYYERVFRALGPEAQKHLETAIDYWQETMDEEPVIYKDINV